MPDNLRSGVTRPHRYEPDVNATYQDMAAHYGIVVIPARPYKPRDKAKVEAGVLLAERWIMARLRNERFTSLGEANVAIRRLVAWVNARPFKKIDGSREALFAEIDRPALRPLPAERYELAVFRPAKVNIDYHVELDRHYYSVPYIYVGETLDVRMTQSTIEIFRRGRRVASHLRSNAKWHHTTDPAHMPESHRPQRPGRRRPDSPRRSWPHGPIPSRASGPVSASSASAGVTAPTVSKPPVPVRSRCGRSATALSSPS